MIKWHPEQLELKDDDNRIYCPVCSERCHKKYMPRHIKRCHPSFKDLRYR